MKHRKGKRVLRMLIGIWPVIFETQMRARTLHRHPQFLTYTVDFSTEIALYHAFFVIIALLLPTHTILFRVMQVALMALLFAIHTILFKVMQMMLIRSRLLMLIQSRLFSDAHSGLSSTHTKLPDAHMEPPNLFCHLHDNFLDNHYTIVVLWTNDVSDFSCSTWFW